MTKTAHLLSLLAPVAALSVLAGLMTAPAPKPAPVRAEAPAVTAAQHKATVYVFLSTQCMVSKLYPPRLNTLARDYGKRGVALIGVFSNIQEDGAEVAAFAKSHAFTFPDNP